MKRRALRVLAIPLTLAFLAVPVSPALAVTDEPLVLVTAWYWEDQKRQRIEDPTSGTDVAVVSFPNPFCPSPPLAGSPPDQTCKPGRLPVQVREGDYETPNQLPAIGFDMALVPPKSKIANFTVTFVEASDEQSEPLNSEGKSLQACFVEDFFGDGEASLYSQIPKHTCSKTDPVAERKEIKTKKKDGAGAGGEQEEPTFGYTFDLTEFARKWTTEGTPVTAILLMPVRPKDADFDPVTDTNWRTVLIGSVDPEENGVKTSLSYTPPPTPVVDPLPPVTPTDPGGGTSFDPGSSVTTSTGSGGLTPTDTGATDVPAPVSEDEAPAPTELGEVAAPAAATLPKGLPGYVWLAILAGIVGLSMVRSVVLENASGIRPDGVLAQIRKLNASRRGVDVAAATGGAEAGGFAAVLGGLKSIGDKSGGILGKLNFRKKA